MSRSPDGLKEHYEKQGQLSALPTKKKEKKRDRERERETERGKQMHSKYFIDAPHPIEGMSDIVFHRGGGRGARGERGYLKEI